MGIETERLIKMFLSHPLCLSGNLTQRPSHGLSGIVTSRCHHNK